MVLSSDHAPAICKFLGERIGFKFANLQFSRWQWQYRVQCNTCILLYPPIILSDVVILPASKRIAGGRSQTCGCRRQPCLAIEFISGFRELLKFELGFNPFTLSCCLWGLYILKFMMVRACPMGQACSLLCIFLLAIAARLAILWCCSCTELRIDHLQTLPLRLHPAVCVDSPLVSLNCVHLCCQLPCSCWDFGGGCIYERQWQLCK